MMTGNWNGRLIPSDHPRAAQLIKFAKKISQTGEFNKKGICQGLNPPERAETKSGKLTPSEKTKSRDFES